MMICVWMERLGMLVKKWDLIGYEE
jgi:hypothetical protein